MKSTVTDTTNIDNSVGEGGKDVTFYSNQANNCDLSNKNMKSFMQSKLDKVKQLGKLDQSRLAIKIMSKS